MGSIGESSERLFGEENVQNEVSSYGTVNREDSESRERWRLCYRLYPAGFKQELKLVFSLAWPATLTSLFTFLMGPISLMFCGHLGREELDGVSLAISLLNITGCSIAYGMSSACDTFFSQAYGSTHKFLVGIFLQRSVMILSLCCFICWSLHLNAEAILLLMGQNPAVAKIAADYMVYFMPGIYCNFLVRIFIKYLQNQNSILPPVFIGAIANGFNALAQYIAVIVLNTGIIGSSVAQALSQLVMCLLLLMYIICSGMYKETWCGWTWQALENWGQFFSLSMAGLVMMVISWWTYEVGVFLSGLLGEAQLAAMAITFQLQVLFCMFPAGVSVAASVRVGHNLGAGNAEGAKTSHWTAQTFSWMIYLLAGTLALSLKNVLPLMFSHESDIIQLTSKTIIVLAAVMFIDSITVVNGGTFRGCGRQYLGAVCNFVGYILITIPLAAVLMFPAKMGAVGFWMGLSIGITPIAIYYTIIMLYTDWDNQVEKAQKRISVPCSNSETADTKTGGNEVKEEIRDQTKSDLWMTSLSSANKRRLLICRLMTVLLSLTVLMGGVFVRVFVPLPISAFRNETVAFVNVDSVTSNDSSTQSLFSHGSWEQ